MEYENGGSLEISSKSNNLHPIFGLLAPSNPFLGGIHKARKFS
jgi:hypothetical protein